MEVLNGRSHVHPDLYYFDMCREAEVQKSVNSHGCKETTSKSQGRRALKFTVAVLAMLPDENVVHYRPVTLERGYSTGYNLGSVSMSK